MADVPFLGCKISLISKCDIRYEGILYCVDPKESTISLSKVRSYGTETRGDPANYVPPKNDVYDVIIFRASDVKDLRVDAPEPPVLSDPAIISARHSSNNTSDGINNGSLPTSSGPSHQQSQPAPHHQRPSMPFLSTGSNKDQQQTNPVTNYSAAVASSAQRRARPDSRKAEHEAGGNRKSETSSGREGFRRGGDNNERRSDKREDRRDDRREDRRDDRRDDRRSRPVVDRRDNHYDGNRRRDDGGGRPQRMNNGGYERHNNANPRYNNNVRDRRGPPAHRDDDSKNNVNRRRPGPMQGGRRGRSGDRVGVPRGLRKTAPLKFEGEYDFDEANKQFLELEGKLKSLKIGEGEKQENGEAGEHANSKSPRAQSESGSGYDTSDDHKDGDSKDSAEPAEYYDKSKSFFDNISCEASERGQGKIGKPDWRKERQTNAETFGISANYRRGGYRGRSFGANAYRRR